MAGLGLTARDPAAQTTGGNGLKGQYYDNQNLTAHELTRTDPTVNFSWGTGSPARSIDPDTFSVRWTGQVEAPASGTYTFYTQTSDGVRLWVNGERLIGKWVNQRKREWSGTISLEAGKRYPIKMEYFEGTGEAAAKLL